MTRLRELTLTLTVTLLAGCGDAPHVGWYSPAWAHRIPLSIHPSSVGVGIESSLTGFPVYVDLSTLPTAFFDSVAQQGRDLLVTQSDGVTPVPREVVFVNRSTRTGELHFRAPLLDALFDSQFYLYYGNPEGHIANDDSTWSEHYDAVFHLDNRFTVRPDATGHHRDGTPVNGKPALPLWETATYDAFGLMFRTADDTITNYYRRSFGHTDGGILAKRDYSIARDQWGPEIIVFRDPRWNVSSVAGGIVDGHILIWFALSDDSGAPSKSLGYIRSKDLAGNEWSPRVTLPTTCTLYDSYGALIATGRRDTWVQGWYEICPGDLWRLNLYKTTDGGSTWRNINISATHEEWVEGSIVSYGQDRLLMLLRHQNGSYLGQTTSTDGGETWTPIVETSLGLSGVNMTYALHDGDRLWVGIGARGNAREQVSLSDAERVWSDPKAYAPPIDYAKPILIGYPSLLPIDDDKIYMLYSDGPAIYTPTVHSYGGPSKIDGVMGGAERFDASGRYTTIDASKNAFLVGLTFTVSAFVLAVPGNHTILGSDGVDDWKQSNQIGLDDALRPYLRLSVGDHQFIEARAEAPLPAGARAHLTFVRDTLSVHIFVDGAEQKVVVTGAGYAAVPFGWYLPWGIGIAGPTVRNTAGFVDEIRVADIARSVDWIAAEHRNLAAPGSFYDVLPVEDR